MVELAENGGYINGLLRQLIRLDQLIALRVNVGATIPANFAVGFVVLLVASHYGETFKALLWFGVTTGINLLRLAQWVALPSNGAAIADPRIVERRLRLFSASAFISGCAWAFIPIFCNGYTGPQTVFYLVILAGITAGAITQSTSYALTPACFITPPLVSILGCLLYAGGFEYDALAVTAFLFNLALIRSASGSEAAFRESSRLKHEAVRLADSLRQAHSNALIIAKQMTHRAGHDELTGLLNRVGFMQEVEARLDDSQPLFCMMILDLDGFKSVNDVYGHFAGDKVLIEVARRLCEALDKRFTIARLGADEFAILYDTADVDGAPAELATQLVTMIEVPFPTFDVGRLATCIGVYTGRGQTINEMLTCADEALYVAKSNGRNRFYIFDEILRERSEMRRDAERDLPRALAEEQLEMWYQPIFSTKTKELVNLEALLRWRHPRHGLIPPYELIMVAAMAGLAETLLRYVFRQVCSMIAELRSQGAQHVRVAMNISPREISTLPIDEILLAGLAVLDVPASMLEIEITEETALDIRSVQDKLIRLAAAKVKITIDDFGVGYSSLATLRQSYISKIKIDYSFIRGVARSPENQILVQAILNLGRSMKVQVVTEGVETEEDLDWLEQTGGDLLQGYYLKPPTPKTAIIEWLQQRNSASFA